MFSSTFTLSVHSDERTGFCKEHSSWLRPVLTQSRADASMLASASAAQRILERCMAFAGSLQLPTLQSLSSQVCRPSSSSSNSYQQLLATTKLLQPQQLADGSSGMQSSQDMTPEAALVQITTALRLNAEQNLVQRQAPTHLLASAAYDMLGAPSLAAAHAMVPLDTDAAVDRATAYAASAIQVCS